MAKKKKARRLVKKKEMEFIPTNIVVKFKLIITGTPKLKLEDPKCETGFYFQLWITNGGWSWGPSGPTIEYLQRVKVDFKTGKVHDELSDNPIRIANTEIIEKMKETLASGGS
jgi:hypothetical protein